METRPLGLETRQVSVVGICLPLSPAIVRTLVPRAVKLGCNFFTASSAEARQACGNREVTVLHNDPTVITIEPGDPLPATLAPIVQAPYNLLDHAFARDHFSTWRKEGHAIVATNVLLGGVFRSGSTDPRIRPFECLVKKCRTLAQAAIQFVLANESVSAALVRVSTVAHLEEVLAAPDSPPLTGQELEQIFELYANRFE